MIVVYESQRTAGGAAVYDSQIGSASVSASLATVDSPDTLTGSIAVGPSASLSKVDASDTLSATFVLGNTIAASLAVTDGPDSLAAFASLSINASVAVMDQIDTLTGTGILAATAMLAATDSVDVLAGTGYIGDEPPASPMPRILDGAPRQFTTLTSLPPPGTYTGCLYNFGGHLFYDSGTTRVQLA